MTRYGGLFFILVLGLTAVGLRLRTQARAAELLRGEWHGRQTIQALYEDSIAFSASGRPHPGLASLAGKHPGMQILDELSAPDRTYAQDDLYVYAFATTSAGAVRRSHGFILRAWPLRFGETGDREFHIDQDGILYEGLNRKGRSGTSASGGFPPAMPDPLIGQLKTPWFPAPAVPAGLDLVGDQR